MKDLIISWLLGICFGAIGVTLFYDGFVADEHKRKLYEAGKALERAHKEIKIRDTDINILIDYIEETKKKDKRLQKHV